MEIASSNFNKLVASQILLVTLTVKTSTLKTVDLALKLSCLLVNRAACTYLLVLLSLSSKASVLGLKQHKRPIFIY